MIDVIIPMWFNPMVKYETNTIKHVIANLKTILENKTEIMKTEETIWNEHGSKRCYYAIKFDKLQFNIGLGLCHNADLYSLEHLNPSVGDCLSLEKYLACKFRNANDGDVIDGKLFSWTYPIEVNDLHQMWRCEQRWEYAEFCLDELEYLLKNNKVKGV